LFRVVRQLVHLILDGEEEEKYEWIEVEIAKGGSIG